MVIQEFEAAGGGFVPEIIGKKFAGKKDGTWRRIIDVDCDYRRIPVNVEWENESGKSGVCYWTSFKSWCRKPAFVIEE